MDPKNLAEFRKEVEIMSKIYHPNIVLFMGACTQPGTMAIITELLKCDLETLLRTKDSPPKPRDIPLLKRMKMAKDAALGMTWLHGSNPAIIHRDLKCGNLLVDENGTVKICDFGLSAIKPKGAAAIRDGVEGPKGTPLWMAPEVMQGEMFNEKADVYSFGIVLWEILTQEEPFAEFETLPEFRDAVCLRQVRPNIPDSCLPRLKALITACWDPKPAVRPTFPRIVTDLDTILVEIAIGDPVGREFWSAFKEDSVPWSQFLPLFEAKLSSLLPQPWPADQRLPEQPSSFHLRLASDRQLEEYRKRSHEAHQQVVQEYDRRNTSGSSDPVLTIERQRQLYLLLFPSQTLQNYSARLDDRVTFDRFGDILEWFGPIVDHEDCLPFLDRLEDVCSKPWFHADLGTRQAENLLVAKPIGTFLVRFSSTAPGCYTISKVSSTRSVSHHRVIHSRGRGFHVSNNRYESLAAIVADSHLGLSRPCSGSTFYNELYGDQKSQGYVTLDETV